MREDLLEQIAELTSVHKGLSHVVEHDAHTLVSGALGFEASADGLETISESFDVELSVPRAFPERFPQVRETGGRIRADYEHRNREGTLCLAVPIEERRVFLDQPTLLGYVDGLLVPYLYGYSFWTKHGFHPFDEAPHGSEGILRHYVDTLGVPDPVAALAVISFLFEHGYRGHHPCPCGSGCRVRVCHGPALRALHDQHTPETLRADFAAILGVCFVQFEKGQLSFPRALRSQLVRLLNRLMT